MRAKPGLHLQRNVDRSLKGRGAWATWANGAICRANSKCSEVNNQLIGLDQLQIFGSCDKSTNLLNLI